MGMGYSACPWLNRPVSLTIHVVCICDREFAKSIPRPFSVRYNPYTESIELIKDKPSIQKVISDIKYSVDVLQDAMGKMK